MDIHVEIDETKEGRVSIQAPAIFKNLVDTIPGRHYNSKERYWDAPLSYPVYLMLLGTFGHRLVVGEKYKKWIDDTYQNQIYPSLIMRDQPSAEGYSFLYPHQNADVRFLTNIERGILASGLGSGKSRSAAATVRRLYEMGKNPFPVLIVCPNSTKISWKREIEAVWPELKTVVVSGSMTQRRRQIKEFVGEEPCLIHNPPEDYKPKGKKKPVCTCKGHILIMNWESLRSHSKLAPWGNVSMTRCQACGGADPKVSEAQCHAHPKELNHIEFNTVIADECFTEDVLVATPSGSKKISQIEPGDTVLGYDHDTESVVECRVLDTMSRDSSVIMGSISGTPNHPYYVVGEGYRQAGDLNESDILYRLNGTTVSDMPASEKIFQDKDMRNRDMQTGDDFDNTQTAYKGFPGSKGEAKSAEGMPLLRGGIFREKEKPVLFKNLFGKIKIYCGAKSQIFRTNEKELGRERPIQGKSLRVPAQRQESGSDFYAGKAVADRENILVKSSNWAALDQNNPVAAELIQSSVRNNRLQTRSTSSDGRWGISSILRSRYFNLGRKDSNRSRWLGSSSEKGVRSSTYSAYRDFGVVRHPVLELRSGERYRRVLQQSALPAGETVKVYSITTETGNYFADNILVRNCHKIKDPSTHMARSLRAATGNAKYRIAMTGTPIANSVVDLWSTLNWLYPESFPAKSRFIDRYLISSLNPYGAMTILGIQENMRQELFNIIDPILRRMPKEVILPFLPPVVYEKRYVDMGTKQAKAYDQMQKRMVALLDDDQMVVSVNPVTKMLLMLQFASSYATAEDIKYIDPETGHEKTKTEVTLAEPSAKLDAFIDDLEEFEGHSIVVFTPFKQLLDLLGARLEKLGIPYGRITGDESSIERQVHMDNFQQGLTKIILATPGAGGTGITLTKADIAVYLGRPWSNIDSEQSEGRIHRLGSEVHDKITYIDYISSNTVEDKVFDALDRKGYTLQEILRDEELINKLIRNEDIDDKQ